MRSFENLSATSTFAYIAVKSEVGNSTSVLILDAVPTLPIPETNDPTRSTLPNVVVPIPTPPPASAE